MLRLHLRPADQAELVRLRDTASEPYLRERAGALVKIAAGQSAAAVARDGLLRQRKPQTVADWVKRYQTAGIAGLRIRPGRGRKPAFFPPLPDRRPGHRRLVAPAAAHPPQVRG